MDNKNRYAAAPAQIGTSARAVLRMFTLLAMEIDIYFLAWLDSGSATAPWRDTSAGKLALQRPRYDDV